MFMERKTCWDSVNRLQDQEMPVNRLQDQEMLVNRLQDQEMPVNRLQDQEMPCRVQIRKSGCGADIFQ
jgi:hypothetical protein